MQLKIMRGAPGSGKTTYVRDHFLDGFVISADAYHVGKDGVYRFNPAYVQQSHDGCVLACVTALQRRERLVVIDNTNVRVWELAVYYRLGEAFGYNVEVVTLLAPVEVCKIRNTHGVPEKTVEAMCNGMEPLPPHWRPQTLIWTGAVDERRTDVLG